MKYKTLAIALLSLFSLLAAPAAMPIATAKPTSCSNTGTQTWSPTANPNVVVTVTVAACVATTSNGSTFGVHSVTSGANSATIQPGAADYYFEGQRAECVFQTQCLGNFYLHEHMTSGTFPNDSGTFGPFSSSNPLVCAVTNVKSFAVVYQPTGESHSFTNVFAQQTPCA